MKFDGQVVLLLCMKIVSGPQSHGQCYSIHLLGKGYSRIGRGCLPPLTAPFGCTVAVQS